MFSAFYEKKEEQPVIAEYIWVGRDGLQLHSKSRTLETTQVKSLKEIPNWAYDGSSIDLISLGRSEIILKPAFYCKDPFRAESGLSNAILVLCTSWEWSLQEGGKISTGGLNTFDYSQVLQPAVGNYRARSEQIWNMVEDEGIQFEIEQEYKIDSLNNEDVEMCCCDQGAQMRSGRVLSDTHYKYCLEAGLAISGANSRKLQYSIGVCEDIEIADQLLVSRFILYRVAEQLGISISFSSKQDSAARVTFSTAKTRVEARKANANMSNNLVSCLKGMLGNLAHTHQSYLQCFREESQEYNVFTHGIDDRSCLFRVPTEPILLGTSHSRVLKGSLEDRRPSANMNPYLVCSLIAQSVLVPDLPILAEPLIIAFSSQDLPNLNITSTSESSD